MISSPSYNATLNHMMKTLSHVIPPVEIAYKAELVAEILELKAQKNAVILGHNYMEPALFHTIPDFKGDSLELARRCVETKADIIVFCGVEFMAETAKILNPSKSVLIPSKKAGCSLAQSITAADVRALKARFPTSPVVTYINSYADVKSETDICVTSSNAAKIVMQLDAHAIIFIPDEYLAQNVAKETGRSLYSANSTGPLPDAPVLITWPGRCEVHELFQPSDVDDARAQFGDELQVLAHPECTLAVCEKANFTGSTSAMNRFVETSDHKQFLLLTECSMADNILAQNPQKDMVRLCSHRCPHMAQITLEMTRDALKFHRYEVHVPELTSQKALQSITRMLEMS